MIWPLAVAVVLLLWAASPTGAAEPFEWSAPERLAGDGVAGAARSVEAAAALPRPAVRLRTCAAGARWKLDEEEDQPAPAGAARSS